MGNTRDYYADLELPPTADVQDIKKQFRKLALKYHPDRNPGREQEVNSQFQIIQLAHEVLSDPQQKAKFDATLGRNRYSGASGVKGNPWSNVGQQFPTPPRRKPQNPGNPPSGAGAQRWQTRFSSGVPPTAKQHTASDPEAKKNAAKAFENMRKNQSQANSKPAARDPRGPPPPPPRTDAAKQRAQASFGNRKSGFVPRSSMTGDEPPVTGKNYYTRANAERPEPETAEARRPQPTPMPDPLSQFRERDRDYVDPRQSTPYTQHGGEKTNPFDGVPISRAKSNRERSRRDESAVSEEGSSGQKHRSSSVPKNAAKDDSAPGLSVPDDDQRPHTADEATGTSYGQASYKDGASAKYTPSTNANAHSTDGPAPQGSNAPSTDTPTKGRGNSGTGPSMYGTSQNAHSHQPQPRVSVTDHTTPKTNPKSAIHGYGRVAPIIGLYSSPQNRAPSGGYTTRHKPSPFERRQHELLDHLINNAGASQPIEKRKHRNTISNHAISEGLADRTFSNSFSFSVEDDTFTQTSPDHSRFSRSSIDDINTQFVNDEGSAWRFNAGSGEQGANQANQSRSRKGPRSPTKRPSVPPNNDDTARDEPSRSASGFNADGWSDKFGPQTFVPQSTPGTSASPTRAGRAGGKKSKTAKPTAGNAAVVEDDTSDEEAYQWQGRKSQAQAAEMDSPQAMDIDSPPAAPQASPQPNGVRNIPVEPSRPDWRPGNVEGMNGNATAEEQGKRFNPNAVGSEDSEDFRATLGDLRNVEPFAQPHNSGLKSLSDLKDNLPFESKASQDISIKLPKAPPLRFPSPPKAPQRPPTVAINGMMPNVMSWKKYVSEFEGYLKTWDAFNAQVVDHFATRNSQISNTRAEKGYAFLASLGDADVQDYYNSVQQDNDVRRRWREACEEHEKRFREFMAFREKMKMV